MKFRFPKCLVVSGAEYFIPGYFLRTLPELDEERDEREDEDPLRAAAEEDRDLEEELILLEEDVPRDELFPEEDLIFIDFVLLVIPFPKRLMRELGFRVLILLG